MPWRTDDYEPPIGPGHVAGAVVMLVAIGLLVMWLTG